VSEVALSGEDHRDSVFIASSDDIFVLFRPAGLDDCHDTRLGGAVNGIWEREECIRYHYGTRNFIPAFVSSNIYRIYSRHLPSTDSSYNFVAVLVYFGKNNSIRFKNLAEMKFSKDLSNGLCIGRSSCYAAMQIALWMDFDKIFLFGVDMDADGINGQLHFYGVNPDVDPNVRKNRFKDEATYYDKAAESLDPEERKKFYFCSDYNKWSFVKEFNHCIKSVIYFFNII
jgi:hypothetical protein